MSDPIVPKAQSYYLTVVCPDQKGIIAAITGKLTETGANIINMSQHTSQDLQVFMLKAEFEAGPDFDLDSFRERFQLISQDFRMKWKLFPKAHRPRTAILVSKTSHCLYELLLKHEDGELACEFPVIISNHQDLKTVADQFGIPYRHVDTSQGRIHCENQIQTILEEFQVELVVLARYMQILTKDFTERWNYRIINIHHGFLPAFMGAKPYHQAWYKGVKIIGATAHFANENLDQGPIIAQDVIRVNDTFSISEFIQVGKDVERRVLFTALKLYLEHSVFVHENRTFILP